MENTLPAAGRPAVPPARTDPRGAGWTGRGGFRSFRKRFAIADGAASPGKPWWLKLWSPAGDIQRRPGWGPWRRSSVR